MSRHTKHLAVFDIDGTLTHTADVADRVFVQTVTTFLGIPDVEMNWPDATHGTDAGALNYLLSQHGLPKLTNDNLLSLQRAYGLALRSELISAQPVIGAKDALRAIADSDTWSLAFATGNWLEPALYKLEVCGLSTHGAPIASSSDSHNRAHILRQAIASSGSRGKVVYFGDREWDKSAAHNLNVAFVAVGTAVTSEHVLPDYQDMNRVWTALENAT